MVWQLVLLALLGLLCVILWVRVVLLMVRQPDRPRHDQDFLCFKQLWQTWKEFKAEKNTE